MSDNSKRPRKDAPDFYFSGSVNWYSDEEFLAVVRPAAYGLYWAAIAWSRGKLKDGFVPDGVLVMLAGQVKADPKLDRAELVGVGKWVNAKGGIRIRDFSVYNDTKASVEWRKERAKKGADARWSRDATSNASSTATSNAEERIGEDRIGESSKSSISKPSVDTRARASDADARVDEYERRIAEAQRAQTKPTGRRATTHSRRIRKQ